MLKLTTVAFSVLLVSQVYLANAASNQLSSMNFDVINGDPGNEIYLSVTGTGEGCKVKDVTSTLPLKSEGVWIIPANYNQMGQITVYYDPNQCSDINNVRVYITAYDETPTMSNNIIESRFWLQPIVGVTPVTYTLFGPNSSFPTRS